jgi:membrane fusion protein (multidrug efflux system)
MVALTKVSPTQFFQGAQSDTASAGTQQSPRRLRRVATALLAGTALVGALALVGDYWTTGRFQVSTDDAYVAADSTAIAPKVSGYIKQVLVSDNQPVKAGDVLATIDDSDFTTALTRARADVAAAQADVVNLRAQIDQQAQAISAAGATIAADKAQQVFAQQDFQRYTDLVHTGYGTVQKVQQAQSSIRQAIAAVARDEATLASAQKQTEVLRAQLAKAEAAVQRDQAVAQQAELNEGYTTIVAPVDGVVGARALRVGSYVQAGTRLMQIVPLHDVYVTANFKETQLTDVHAGQPVTVEVDTYPGVKFAGHVDSIAPASGQEFALLPPDNATGNFTKIVQRIPVKIALEPASDLVGRLRPGMSVEADIDTKPGHAPQDLSRFAAR